MTRPSLQARARTALFSLALSSSAASALADPPAAESSEAARLPVAAAMRPLTLPRLVLSPDVDLHLLRISGSDRSFVNLTGQVAFGVFDDWTVRALVLPLELAGPTGGVHYGQTDGNKGPSIGTTYRIVRGDVELGVNLDARVFTAPDVTGFALVTGVPLRVHLGNARLDAEVRVNVTRATQTAPVRTPADAVRLRVPVSALYDIVETVHVGITTGLTINDLSDVATTTGIPLGAFAGYTVTGKEGPLLDIGPYFTFPYLVMPGRPHKTYPGEYQVGVQLRGFFYL